MYLCAVKQQNKQQANKGRRLLYDLHKENDKALFEAKVANERAISESKLQAEKTFSQMQQTSSHDSPHGRACPAYACVVTAALLGACCQADIGIDISSQCVPEAVTA